MAEVQLQGISRRWGNVVVDYSDRMIPDREFLVLSGPTGCGKSMTIRMIPGFEASAKGDILVNGRRNCPAENASAWRPPTLSNHWTTPRWSR